MSQLSPDNIPRVQRPKEIFTYTQDNIQATHIRKINDDPFPLELKKNNDILPSLKKRGYSGTDETGTILLESIQNT